MIDLVFNPLFSILLCFAAFGVGRVIQRGFPFAVCNPLLLANILVICFLVVTGMPYEIFDRGGSILSLFLAPATVSLALAIYRQRAVLRRSIVPVTVGCLVGAATSLVSVSLLSRLMGLDQVLTASLLPKSVTTPIAVELAESMGGIPAVATAAVILSGITGGVLSPLLIRLLRIKNPVAAGIAIGASSHALGTTKAVELGEVEGAMSGIAIGLSGLVTVGLYLIYAMLLG